MPASVGDRFGRADERGALFEAGGEDDPAAGVAVEEDSVAGRSAGEQVFGLARTWPNFTSMASA